MVIPARLPGRVSVESAVRAHVPHESPFQPRAAIAGKDARTLARELLAMTQEEFSRAFSKSPRNARSCAD